MSKKKKKKEKNRMGTALFCHFSPIKARPLSLLPMNLGPY